MLSYCHLSEKNSLYSSSSEKSRIVPLGNYHLDGCTLTHVDRMQ